MTKTFPENSWAAELRRFTSRNSGRATKLEVDSPDYSAKRETGFPLRAIAYDSADQRVLITLGDQTEGDLNLTHSIKDALAIFVLVDARGRDEALAIAHKDSQTLLRFLDL